MTNNTRSENINPGSRAGARDNNFALVRLTAALFVFCGHQAAVMGCAVPALGGIPIQELGVGMLFLISGYLITKSWLSDPDPLRFAIRRFFRLYPPFAVVVLLLTFVAGPLLSELGTKGYFESTYLMFLKNLRLFIVYYLPGVFSHVPVPDTVNGSFWTMPVEAGLYVLTPLLLSFIRVRRRPKSAFYFMSFVVAAALVIDTCIRTFFPNTRKIFYATEFLSSWHVIVFYFIGVLFTFEQAKKLLNLQVGCVAMSIMMFSPVLSMPMQYLTMYLVFPYFVLSLVFDTKPVFRALNSKMDLSYGIYLYGFFFQQLVVYFKELNNWTLSYIPALLISAVPTVLAALLSYYLVERPSLRLSRFLVNKLKARSAPPAAS